MTDPEQQSRTFPYYCANCEQRVQLAATVAGEFPDAEQESITVACGCTSVVPSIVDSSVRPDCWQVDFDEVLDDD